MIKVIATKMWANLLKMLMTKMVFTTILRELAENTETKVDDYFVDLGEALYDGNHVKMIEAVKKLNDELQKGKANGK